MEDWEIAGLKAKVSCANGYLAQVLRHRGKIDAYDIMKVVTQKMRPFVEIVSAETAKHDGMGIIRIKGVA